MPHAERVMHELRARLLEVVATELLTPAMKRVVLTGDGLEGFRSPAPDDHVKLLFSPVPDQPPALPRFEPGAPRYADGVTPPLSRDFTPRRFDVARPELTIDFVLHGTGPASSWAATAQPGALVGQVGPRGSLIVSGDVDWHLLASDEAGLPALARRLEELPPGARVDAFVEVADEAAQTELPTRADLRLTWLHRDGRPAGTTDLLEQALRAWDPPAGEGFAWAAAEAGAARALRRHLRDERGLPRAWTRVTGYWKRGAADHHDPPDEEG